MILAKGTITSHLNSMNTKNKTMTYDIGYTVPGLERAQKYGRVKPVVKQYIKYFNFDNFYVHT